MVSRLIEFAICETILQMNSQTNLRNKMSSCFRETLLRYHSVHSYVHLIKGTCVQSALHHIHIRNILYIAVKYLLKLLNTKTICSRY